MVALLGTWWRKKARGFCASSRLLPSSCCSFFVLFIHNVTLSRVQVMSLAGVFCMPSVPCPYGEKSVLNYSGCVCVWYVRGDSLDYRNSSKTGARPHFPSLVSSCSRTITTARSRSKCGVAGAASRQWSFNLPRIAAGFRHCGSQPPTDVRNLGDR